MKNFLYALLAFTVSLVLLFAQPSRAQQNCDPSYPDVCIAPAPPDLDCADVSATNFRVLQPDPHKFDRDKDGIGCEA
ncbi:excalibur calcium-binding domain-containing protein [Oculatella sp. FACHB-28]|uniref:excalibur calcium-binding domain-containing protein n=1 Tax=Cyanophyceae TaxID=3028117 RepID=UPI00168674B4|nr:MULTISPECIES: excalibur calcium-binding domain-containing protein [Cyanophyceae]MBD1999224.1 excalibur calcium-binding domain-containing protein [Leptolyngbya sp. FACHB-541]MBD2054608.1 excalibur calcium-binding domain-containing protein [Oculatella sp. FACHB-28]